MQPTLGAGELLEVSASACRDFQPRGSLSDSWLCCFASLYRATMDADLLPDLYTLLRGSVNHQLHLATKGSDGKLHMPVMKSPEYPLPSLGGDTNYQLALTKWGLRYVRQLSCQHSRKSLKHEAAAQYNHRHLQDAGVPGPEAGGVRHGAE